MTYADSTPKASAATAAQINITKFNASCILISFPAAASLFLALQPA
jgi:hypothetical protein